MVRLDEDPSRAQIVLVGALAIAFIVLGIVVVFNTSLYAENVDSTGTVSSVNQAEQVRHAGGDSVAGVAYRVNDGTFATTGDAATAIRGNLTNFSAVWQGLYAQSQPTVLNASFNDSVTHYGVRVFSTGNESFEANTMGSSNWSVTKSSDPTYFANATMTVMGPTTLSNSSDDSFRVAVLGEGGSGFRWRVLRFTHDRNGNDNLTIQSATGTDSGDPGNNYGDSTPAGAEVCDIDVGDEFIIDLSNGSVQGSSSMCSFEFTTGLDPINSDEGYELRLMNPDNVSGRYSMILRNESTITGRFFDKVPTTPAGAPSYSYVAWAAGVDIEYGSPTSTYNQTITVPVYNSTR